MRTAAWGSPPIEKVFSTPLGFIRSPPNAITRCSAAIASPFTTAVRPAPEMDSTTPSLNRKPWRLATSARSRQTSWNGVSPVTTQMDVG